MTDVVPVPLPLPVPVPLPVPLPVPNDNVPNDDIPEHLPLPMQDLVAKIKAIGHRSPAPSQSRHDKFLFAFRLCMYQMAHMYVQDDTVCEWTWTITNITSSARSPTQIYRFTIPHRYQIGEVTHEYTDVNGDIHVPGPIYAEQHLPSTIPLRIHMTAFFDPYRRYVAEQYAISQVAISILEDDDEGIHGEMQVVYVDKHLPFYVDRFSPLQEMEMRHQYLQSAYDKLKRNAANVLRNAAEMAEMLEEQRAQNALLRRQLSQSRNRTQAVVRELREVVAAGNPIVQDCPICFEPIATEQLGVAGTCCHFVCMPCLVRCTSCPICRLPM